MYLFFATRPAMGLIVVFLVFASFRVQGMFASHLNAVMALGVIEFLAVSATMVWNDYYDRAHDAKRGKTYALGASCSYAWTACILWAFALISSAIFFLDTPMVSVVIALQAVASFIYGPARRVPMGSCLLVAVTSASGTLFPLWFEPLVPPERLWVLTASTFCLVVGRELLGDIRDAKWDQGYKQTLVVIKGAGVAFRTALFFLLLAGSGAFLIAQPGWRYLGANAIFCLGITAITSIRGITNFHDPLARIAVVKRLVDVALIIFLSDLLWSGPGAVALGFFITWI
jgi:4-hydroxybenzoate polyprenyltransferase